MRLNGSARSDPRWLGHMRAAVPAWPCRRRRPPVEIGRDEPTRERKGGKAGTVASSTWPTTEPLARTLVRTRALLARPWWTPIRALCMHRGREAVCEVREGLRRAGGCFSSRWAAGNGTRTATARGTHAAASKAHVGHVPGRVFTPQAFPRIRGGCQSGHRFWAICRLNLDMGPIQNLLCC
jgi:hypothetical protein